MTIATPEAAGAATAPPADVGNPADRPPAIEVVGLRKSYGGREVLRDVTFGVAQGEIFGLLGPNGAGKTTTVEIIEGYRRADAGNVRVLGSNPATSDRSHRARVGLMLQAGGGASGGIDPRLTAREVVGLYGRFHESPRDVDEVLDLVGLGGTMTRTRYRRLSGGERQRVGLALALVGNPELLILDEPTSGMDVEARRSTRALLAALRDDGVTILLTSHDLADVERLADRLAIVDRGRIVAAGSVAELTETSPVLHFAVAEPVDDAALRRLGAGIRESGPVAVVVDAGAPARYRIAGAMPSPALIASIAAWAAAESILLLDLRTGGGTLEDRYLELTGAERTEPGEPHA